MSIVHLVCWKYKADTSTSVREEHISRLLALKGIVPEIVEFAAGFDVLHLDRSFDMGLFSRFADRDGLDAYTNHPEHQKVAAFGKEISEKVVSVDFEAD